ncbi:Protein SHQ1 [Spathaspora sp. JA1]|nr:Protein SHQ1 [Spathaspora sp. JA1]
MITPFFEVSQDDEFIYINIKISHVRFSSTQLEMIVDQELFIFSLQPYYLRIRLPYACVDDERSNAEFDSKNEVVRIRIAKEERGRMFPDLDLTSKLLARLNEDTTTSSGPLIEELDVDNNMQGKPQDVGVEGETFDWEIKQEVPEQSELTGVKYGFNNQYDKLIGVSLTNGNDINELGDPETTSASDRIIERLIKENIKFDAEIYAADYIMEKYPTEDDDKSFGSLLVWKNPLVRQFLKWYKAQTMLSESERSSVMDVEFTKDEQEKMINLPRRSHLIDPSYNQDILVLIVCLLFAYHFELRETEGDHNIESAWTIGKLVPQFACLDSNLVNADNSDNMLRTAVITCIRRALAYPFHRNFKLVMKVWEDVYYNLRGGKRLVLKALLDLKELFRFHDVYYVYDKIWLDDLVVYLISDNISESTIRKLAYDLQKEYSKVSKIDITFEKVGLDKPQGENIEDDDEIIPLNLQEIELIAEESYQVYRQQTNS